MAHKSIKVSIVVAVQRLRLWKLFWFYYVLDVQQEILCAWAVVIAELRLLLSYRALPNLFPEHRSLKPYSEIAVQSLWYIPDRSLPVSSVKWVNASDKANQDLSAGGTTWHCNYKFWFQNKSWQNNETNQSLNRYFCLSFSVFSFSFLLVFTFLSLSVFVFVCRPPLK